MADEDNNYNNKDNNRLRDCTAAKMTTYAALKFPNPNDISAWVLKLFPPVPQ